jgi:hypothetical protein
MSDRKKCPEVPDRIPTWFSGNPDGMSEVLEVLYPIGVEHKAFVVRASAPKTRRGWMEITYYLAEGRNE